MRIVFMGTPEFAVAPLEYLFNNGFEIAGVYTQPDREAGRGRAIAAPPVKTVAQRLGLPVYQPATLKSREEETKLAGLHPDVIVVAAYGQILRPAVLETPTHGCLNIHPSLLPKYRGVSPVVAAIRAGDEFAGVSIMKLDAGVDTGPVLAQAQVRIMDTDTAGTLTEKLSRTGGQMLAEILPRWVSGTIVPRLQDDEKASYTRKVEKGDGEINWAKPATEIWRQVRALQPWPGSFTRWQGKQLKIIEAVPAAGNTGAPGRVVPVKEGAGFAVETGAGVLVVKQLQLEGKRVMNADEYLRGHRQFIGEVLPNG